MKDVNKLLKIAKRELNDRKVWEGAVDALTDIQSLENSARESKAVAEKITAEVLVLQEERAGLLSDIEAAKGVAPRIIDSAAEEAADHKKEVAASSLKKAKAKIAKAEAKAEVIIGDAVIAAEKFFKEIADARDEYKEVTEAAKDASKELKKINKELDKNKAKLRKLLGEE